MKRFVIKYTYDPASGSIEHWHECVRQFISAIDADPALAGKIQYRCLKVKDSADYYHFVEADDDAPNMLSQREWFKKYTEETKRVAGGAVQVLSIETIAETSSA